MHRRRSTVGSQASIQGLVLFGFVCAVVQPAIAQDSAPKSAPPEIAPQPDRAESKPSDSLKPPPDAAMIEDWTAKGLAAIVSHQEGDGKSEWPYEGVYRERGLIPYGYRIGGTAICAATLLELPGFEADEARRQAVLRAAKFILSGVQLEKEMGTEIRSTYDVRGWGHAYAVAFLVEWEARKCVPEELAAEVKKAIQLSIGVLQKLEIPGDGGWNYARPRGFSAAGPTSPFMTSATLLALFSAAAHGYAVDGEVIDRALDALENARTPQHTYVYAGKGAKPRDNDGAPEGNCARAASAELVLALAGRSNLDALRVAVDQFIEHWEWLEKRRAKTGTHEGPFKIAPYYFYFGHEQAALAAELLPEAERAERRARIHELVARTRAEAGTWNDRIFDRSANYGTAMALRALHAATLPVFYRYAAKTIEKAADK